MPACALRADFISQSSRVPSSAPCPTCPCALRPRWSGVIRRPEPGQRRRPAFPGERGPRRDLPALRFPCRLRCALLGWCVEESPVRGIERQVQSRAGARVQGRGCRGAGAGAPVQGPRAWEMWGCWGGCGIRPDSTFLARFWGCGLLPPGRGRALGRGRGGAG